MSFRVWWQHYPERWRTVRLNESHPPKEYLDFETREEAEACRDVKRRRAGTVATVTPTPEPVVKETAAKRRAQLSRLGFPEMRKRLTA